MDVRIALYSIIIFGGILFKLTQTHRGVKIVRKRYIILVCFFLAIESGLRGLQVGPDTPTYFVMFNSIMDQDWNSIAQDFRETYIEGVSRDPGFPVLVKAFQLISSNFQFFLVIIAILYFSAIGTFIYRHTSKMRDVVFAFTLYVALFQIIGLSGIRQQITTAVSLFALTYIQKREGMKLFIIVLLGSTVHISLLLMLPFYYFSKLSKKRIKSIYIFVLFFVFFLVMAFRKLIATFLLSLLKNDYYLQYTNTRNDSGAYAYVGIAYIVAVLGLVNINKIIAQNRNYKIYYAAVMLMTFFVPLILLNGALIRIGQYFSLYLMIFIPLIINKVTEPKFGILFFSIAIFSLIFLSLRDPFTYYFFWQ